MTPLLAGQVYVATTCGAVILLIGAPWLLGSRRHSGWWPLAALIVCAAVLGVLAGSTVRKADAGSVPPSDFIVPLFLFPGEQWGMLKRFRDLSRQPPAEVKHALPRKGRRQWQMSGFCVGLLGIAGIACCLYIATTVAGGGRLWLFGPMTALLVVWGILAFQCGGRVEFGRRYLRWQSYLLPWSSLGKFEWYTEPDGAPVLRIQIHGREQDLRIHWPEEAAVEAALKRHGLERW